MFRRLSVWILIAATPLSGAVSREMQELQRDVAQLQDLVKSLQTTVNERLSALETHVKSSADAASQANAAVAAVQRTLEQMLRDQENKLVPPMAALGTRMDQVSSSMGTMQQAVSDLASLMTKLQTEIGDLSNAVKVMQAPPTPPPASADTPAIPAGQLFDNADGDRRSGKFDLAQQGFSDYLKWYGSTPLAGDAQYYLGAIHFSQQDFEAAVKDFDAVLKNYSDSKKTPEALFYKGRALLNLGRANEAGDAFKDLRKRFPNHDLAKQSLNLKKP